ncbi:MAG: WecB/TagA/CpsF family glycosyltransferase [Rhodopila sp.]|jgi:exopolysaccharide biosynthesis WecB/TagA/CpsF family protein
MARLKSNNIIGVGVSAMDYDGACQEIIAAAIARQPLTVTALAVHGVMTGALNMGHRRRLNTLDMVLPDGQPVRWALNLLFGSGLKDRVYGPNLMLHVCERAQKMGLSVGFYGNKSDVLDDLCSNLRVRYPDLHIATAMPSLFSRVPLSVQSAITGEIAASGADILFVGLGCPRQEVWLYENRPLLSMPTIAVGAAFDFHANRLAQAPRWMQDRGLEWLFRMVREPRRLWRRYIFLNPMFVSLLALQYVGLRRAKQTGTGDIPYVGYA